MKYLPKLAKGGIIPKVRGEQIVGDSIDCRFPIRLKRRVTSVIIVTNDGAIHVPDKNSQIVLEAKKVFEEKP